MTSRALLYGVGIASRLGLAMFVLLVAEYGYGNPVPDWKAVLGHIGMMMFIIFGGEGDGRSNT